MIWMNDLALHRLGSNGLGISIIGMNDWGRHRWTSNDLGERRTTRAVGLVRRPLFDDLA
jgi:hypothetical protein